MNIKEMTTQHIRNRSAYLKRKLNSRPPEATYGGDSWGVASAVECENRQNEILAEEIGEHIKELNNELGSRLEGDKE